MTDTHIKGIIRLGEVWGQVHISYHPGRDRPYYVTNVTEEGVPIEYEPKEYWGETLDNALAKALNEV